MTRSRGILGARFAWTDDQVATLTRLYPDTASAEIAKALGCKVTQVYTKAKKLGLQKSTEFLASPASGRIAKGTMHSPATAFKPGHSSWIKGKKGVQFAGCKATQFKPGQRSHNETPIGTEREKQGYLWRKVSAKQTGSWRDDWRQVHLLVWEEHHGPVPPGHVVTFRNKNTLDPRIENLECITRAEHTARNTIHRYPPELRQLMRLNGRLKKLIRDKTEDAIA